MKQKKIKKSIEIVTFIVLFFWMLSIPVWNALRISLLVLLVLLLIYELGGGKKW